MSKPSDLVQGTLDLLLLKVLALEPMFSLAFHSAVIQPSCSSLCKAGYSEPSLTCRTSPEICFRRWLMAQPFNRRAKFYSLTRPGRKHLEKEAANWSRLSAAISHVVRLEEA